MICWQAIRLKQLANAAGQELAVCVLEKGSEVGAHILSGNVIDPRALNELIPDWKEKGAPVETAVKDEFPELVALFVKPQTPEVFAARQAALKKHT